MMQEPNNVNGFEFDMYDNYKDSIRVRVKLETMDTLYMMFADHRRNLEIDMSFDLAGVDSLIAALTQARAQMASEAGE